MEVLELAIGKPIIWDLKNYPLWGGLLYCVPSTESQLHVSEFLLDNIDYKSTIRGFMTIRVHVCVRMGWVGGWVGAGWRGGHVPIALHN